jgi:hypothetical protein
VKNTVHREDESLHGQAMAKFEKAIAWIKEAAYLEYCAAEMLQPCHDMYTLLWCSAANLNSLARNDERTFECAIKVLRGKMTKHLTCQLNESLIQSVRQCAFNKVTTDVLDSSNDYAELLVMSADVNYEQ